MFTFRVGFLFVLRTRRRGGHGRRATRRTRAHIRLTSIATAVTRPTPTLATLLRALRLAATLGAMLLTASVRAGRTRAAASTRASCAAAATTRATPRSVFGTTRDTILGLVSCTRATTTATASTAAASVAPATATTATPTPATLAALRATPRLFMRCLLVATRAFYGVCARGLGLAA